MTFAAPLFAWVAGGVALATVALHLLAWRRPPESPLPTARFAPERPIRMVSRAIRPADLALLALRVALVLLVGAALAGPIISARRTGDARVLVVDRSRAAGDGIETANGARSVFREGDALVVFDSVAREVSAPGLDSAVAVAPTDAAGSLSAALILAGRAARRLARDHESVSIVIISPFATEELDEATRLIRGTWTGTVDVRRVALRPNDAGDVGRPEVRAGVGDPVAAAFSLVGPFNDGQRVRIARDALTATDSVWAGEGNAVVMWPVAPPSTWQRAAPTDTAFGVTAVSADHEPAATVVAAFERATSPPTGRVIARWSDGEPAATEFALGAGCIRSVMVPVPTAGDLALTPAFRRFALKLAAPCGNRAPLVAVSDSVLATILPGALSIAPVSVTPNVVVENPRSTLVAWLLGLALVAAAAEVFLRRGDPHATA